MHNIKDSLYENKTKLAGIGEDYQIQVRSSHWGIGTMVSSCFRSVLL